MVRSIVAIPTPSPRGSPSPEPATESACGAKTESEIEPESEPEPAAQAETEPEAGFERVLECDLGTDGLPMATCHVVGGRGELMLQAPGGPSVPRGGAMQ